MSDRSKRFFLLLFVLLTTWNCAFASTWQLDGVIGEIPNRMLAGNDEVTAILLENGITGIGAGAFSNDPGLRLAVIPSTVRRIGEGAFEHCGPVLLQCTPGSAAMRYAQAMHIEYDADTTYRALLIGQSDYPDNYTLQAPVNDVDAMTRVLPGFEVTTVTNLTADGVLAAIEDTFAPGTVKEQDVSLLYYTGHGLENGSLLGIDLVELTMPAFHQALDKIPGRKILILDCCYSGMHLPQGQTLQSNAAGDPAGQFNASVIAEFAAGSARMAMNAQTPENPRAYYVLTACAADELSWETKKGVRLFGVFTRYLAMGLGYDERDEVECERAADTDHDGVITIRELYEYTREEVGALNTPDQQNVQVYPADADDFALYRADPRTMPMHKLGVIEYDACGGSGAPERQIAVIGEPMQTASRVPVWSGHRFDGWSSTKGSNEPICRAGGTIIPAGSMTLYAVWTAVQHEITGDESVWFKGTEDGLTFAGSRQDDMIERVRIDGAALPRSAYTISPDGRTVVLQPEWLNQQATGRHRIEFLFADGTTVELQFEIAPEIPITGDAGAPLLWFVLSVCGIIFLSRKRA